jgi:threonine dehydrogenase-like Zn-dependent dehydrogenase
MPRKIVTRDGGNSFELREFDLPALGASDVRVRVQFSAPKHGTESKILTDNVFGNKRWDPELRMFLPRSAAEPASPAPTERGIGNMVVGVVMEAGPAVTQYKIGDNVFGYGPICEIHTAPESKWYPLGDLSDEDAVAVDPAHVAFVAVRDGNIRIGDDVAVYGLGAIGLMAVQVSRAAGARRVFGVDPFTLRREHALAHGADAVFDPTQCDAAHAIKLATEKQGVDVALEVSGNSRALHDCMRCIRQCGNVVLVAFGPKDNAHLHLDEEFHHNRPTLIGSQAWEGWGNPDRGYPLWTHQRAYDATIQLFRERKLTGGGLINPIVNFDEAPRRLVAMLKNPETTIKMGVRFQGA